MRLVCMVVLALAPAIGAPAADANGKWKLVFQGDPNHWPKTVGQVILDLKSDGKQLTGTAHAGSWPGDTTISNGKIEGDRISFVLIGKGAWRSRSPQGEASGYPRLTFQGTIEGNAIKMRLSWDSIMIYGAGDNTPQEFELTGERVH